MLLHAILLLGQRTALSMYVSRLRVEAFDDLGDPKQGLPGALVPIDPGAEPVARCRGRQQRNLR